MEAKINVPLATDGGLQAIKSEPTWCTAGWREITRLCLESALYLWVSYVLMVDYSVLKAPLQGQWTKVHQDTLKLG